MRPCQHESNNDVLRPPPGVSHDECVPLAITRVQYVDPFEVNRARRVQPAVRSYWMPSREELEALNQGAPVCLEVHGMSHAPLLVGVAKGKAHDLVGMEPMQPLGVTNLLAAARGPSTDGQAGNI